MKRLDLFRTNWRTTPKRTDARPLRWIIPVSVAIQLMASLAMADQPACDQIQHHCGEAGFTRDLPDGKDLMSKCFQPIMNGQEIAGVLVDPDDIKKCHEEQERKPSSQGKRRRRRA